LLVPGPGASAPYDIENKAELYEIICARVPGERIREVTMLDQATPRPGDEVVASPDPGVAAGPDPGVAASPDSGVDASPDASAGHSAAEPVAEPAKDADV
jgi:hypothetical protein